MGYFSQKKKHERENNILEGMALVFGILTLMLFLPADLLARYPFLIAWQFQVYILSGAALIFAIVLSRWVYALFFVICLLINFIVTASTANLFFNTTVDEQHHLYLTYNDKNPLQVESHGMVTLRSGHLNLGKNVQAPFITFDKNLQVFTVIAVDFENLSPKARRKAFKSLRLFITMQDDPVIVYGKFGIPAWSPQFKNFLLASDLHVKNRLLLLGSEYRYNLLAVPDFYVLAFDNVGIADIQVESATKTAPLTIKTELGYY